MSTEVKTIEQMSVEELQLALTLKQKQEQERARKERETYERGINEATSQMVTGAIQLNEYLEIFYNDCVTTLDTMREKLNEYGKIKSNSKGGFHLKTKDGKYKLVYKYSTICDWDERANKAEDLLKDFLLDVVKKRDKELFEIIIGLLEKNKYGKLEYSRMQTLYAKESTFDDPRWKEAIRLFKESFRAVDSKMRLEFYKRNEQSQKWEPITLNISSF